MKTNMKTRIRRAACLVAACGIGAASYALTPTSSPSFRINYSVVPNGVGHMSSASFQARASVVGQTCPRFASITLPVNVSAFEIE